MRADAPDVENYTSHASSERRQPTSSRQEPMFQSPNAPASYEPVTGGLYEYDSDQSTSRDQDAILPDSCPTAYTLEWGPHMPCTRTPLDIDAVGGGRPRTTPGSVQVVDQSRVNFIRHAWKCNENLQSSASAEEAGPSHSPQKSSSQKLFVIRDNKDEETLRTICTVLNMDPAFMAAHIDGERYRPRDRPWRVGAGKNATFTASSYVYPQTLTITMPCPQAPTSSRDMWVDDQVKRARKAAAQNSNGGAEQPQDGGEKAPVAQHAPATAAAGSSSDQIPLLTHSCSTKRKTIESPVAMFCRASLWTGPYTNVLLLDRNPSSTSLEDALFDALDDMVQSLDDSDSGATGPVTVADSLSNALSGLIYDQWLDFVDTLSSNDRGAKQGRLNKKLFWDMAQHLEQNLVTSRDYEKKLLYRQQQWKSLYGNDVPQVYIDMELNATSPDDWRALLSRLERIVALLPLRAHRLADAVADTNTAQFRAADTTFTVSRVPSGDIDSLVANYGSVDAAASIKSSDTRRPGAINGKRSPSFSQTPAGQNALSRITYMGGILLPFSIIAGVLSMSDPFGPGDRLFWVFWVITLPITVLTLAIIYADDIRKDLIWKPMSHESLQRAIRKGEALPAAAAAVLARAAGKVIDKLSATEADSDIESAPVLSAVRPVESSGGTGRRGRVRVDTNSGPGGPALYRLSSRSPPEMTPAASGPEQRPAQQSPAASASGNVEIQSAVMNARVRRRLGILSPFQRAWPSPSKPHTDPPAFPDDIEPAIPRDDTVVIGIASPNVDPSIAEAFGPPSGINVAVPGRPAILLPNRRDGSGPVAWQQQELGWFGAAKKIAGYLKIHDA